MYLRKNFFFTFLITIFLLYISPRLYVNIDYFSKSDPFPRLCYVNFIFNDIQKKIILLNSKDDLVQNYKTIEPMEHSGTLLIDCTKCQRFNIKKITINDKDFSTKFINGKKFLSYEYKENENINISFFSKREIIDVSIFNYINYYALVILSIFYCFLSFFILSNIPNCSKIKDFFYDNRDSLFLFVLLFLVFLFSFSKFYINIDYFRTFVDTADIPFVVEDIFNTTTRRFHPYFFMPFYPIFEFFRLVFDEDFFALGFLWVILASTSCVFLYKSLSFFYKGNKIFPLILTLIFSFSISMLFFASYFEVYILHFFYLSIICYLFLKIIFIDKNQKINLYMMIFLSALFFGVSTFSIITVIFLILFLSIIKKFSIKKIFKCVLLLFSFIILLVGFRSLTVNDDSIDAIYSNIVVRETKKYVSLNFSIDKLNIFYKNVLEKPIISSNIKPRIGFWLFYGNVNLVKFDKSSLIQNIFSKIFVLLFFISWISSFFFSYKSNSFVEFKLILSLSIVLFFNFCCIFFWSVDDAFLYSSNYIIFLFLILGYSFGKLIDICNVDIYFKKHFINVILFILIIFLMFEVYNNFLSMQELYFYSFKVL